MLNFEYYCPTKFVFGKGQQAHVAEYVREFGGTKVLIHGYGESYPAYNELLAAVRSSFETSGIAYVEVSGVEPNPKLGLALKAAQVVRDEKCDFILAVGGGSVIDSAKCAAVAARYDGDVWNDLYIGQQDYPTPVPVGVVLTSAATGSESSPGSVITNLETHQKKFIYRDVNRPKFAVMDPEITYTLPPYQTACGAIDTVSHFTEHYFTSEHDNYLTDMLNESAIRAVRRFAPIAIKDPTNYEARANLMWAASMGMNGYTAVGRMDDSAVHSIQQEIGGLYDSAHGARVGCVTLGWFKYCYKKDLPRFYRYFTEAWGVDPDPMNPEAVILEGINQYRIFLRLIGIPTDCRKLGVREEDLQRIADGADCNPRGKCGNLTMLDSEDIINVLRLCMEGEE